MRTKILKESLICRNHQASPKLDQLLLSQECRNLSYANAVRGRLSDSQSSFLRCWRRRECGSSDVYAAILAEKEPNLVSQNL